MRDVNKFKHVFVILFLLLNIPSSAYIKPTESIEQNKNCISIYLDPGWNLISVPLINTSVKGNWIIYTLTDNKFLKTQSLEPGKGYWVFSNKESKMIVCGQSVNKIIWNLNSSSTNYLLGTLEDTDIQEILKQVKNGKVYIYSYNSSKKRFVELNEKDILYSKRGYLVKYEGKGDIIILEKKLNNYETYFDSPEIEYLAYVRGSNLFVEWWPADKKLKKHFEHLPYLLDNHMYHGRIKITDDHQIIPGPTVFPYNCTSDQIDKGICAPMKLKYKTSLTDGDGNLLDHVRMFIKLNNKQDYDRLLGTVKGFCNYHDCEYKTFSHSKKLVWVKINWKDFNLFMNTMKQQKYFKDIMFAQDHVLIPQLNETKRLIHSDDISLSSYPSGSRHGYGVRIAIIDTGADENHGDLRSRIILKYNVETGDDNITDVVGHGTFIASVVGGSGLASGGEFTGVAPESDLIIVKVDTTYDYHPIYESDVIEGIGWVLDHDPDIILIPLSITDTIVEYIDEVRESMSEDEFPVFVIPAGENYDYYNRPIPFIHHKGSENYISVGMSTKEVDFRRFIPTMSHGELNMMTSGPTYDFKIEPIINAPGAAVIAAWPVGMDRGEYRDPYHRYRSREIIDSLSYDEGNYTYGAGLSISAAHVAGAAAIIKSIHPDWTFSQIKSALILSADYLPYSTTSERTGGTYGRRSSAPYEENATLLEQGSGRINVERALEIPFYVDTPVLNFGRISLSTEELESDITITAYDDVYFTVSIDDPINTYYQSGGAASITTDSFHLSPGESTTLHVRIDNIPEEYDGFFYGYIRIVASDGEEYRIPYLYTKFHEINLVFKTNNTDDYLYCGLGDVINFYSHMELSGGTSPNPHYYGSNVDLESRYFLVYRTLDDRDSTGRYCGYTILLEPGNYTGIIGGALNGNTLFLLEKDFNLSYDEISPKWVNITLDYGSPHHISFIEPGTHLPLLALSSQVGYTYHHEGLRTTSCGHEPRSDCYDDAFYLSYYNIPTEMIFYLSDERVHPIESPEYEYKRLTSLTLSGVPYIGHGCNIDYTLEASTPNTPYYVSCPSECWNYRQNLPLVSDRYYYINLMDIPGGLEMDDFVSLDDLNFNYFDWKTNLPGYYAYPTNGIGFYNSFGASSFNDNLPANNKRVYYLRDTQRLNWISGSGEVDYTGFGGRDEQGCNLEETWKKEDDFYNNNIRLDRLNKEQITFLQVPYYFAILPSFDYPTYEIDWAPMTNDWTVTQIPVISYSYYGSDFESDRISNSKEIPMFSYGRPSYRDIHVMVFNSYPLFNRIYYDGKMSDCLGEPALPPVLKINASSWFNTSQPYVGIIREVPIEVSDGVCEYNGRITEIYYSCGTGPSSDDWHPVSFTSIDDHVYQFEIPSVPCTDYLNLKIITTYNFVDFMNYTFKPFSRLADDAHLNVEVSLEESYSSDDDTPIRFIPQLSWTDDLGREVDMDKIELQVWLCDHKIYDIVSNTEFTLTPKKITKLWSRYCKPMTPSPSPSRVTPQLINKPTAWNSTYEWVDVPLVFKLPSTGTYPEKNQTVSIRIKHLHISRELPETR